MSERLETMRMEMRRGVLVLTVLTALKEEQYGYELRKALQGVGLDIEEGTLYPLVRRLENYGLLSSRWSAGDGRRRRYYQTSKEGLAMLQVLKKDWDNLNFSLATIWESAQLDSSVEVETAQMQEQGRGREQDQEQNQEPKQEGAK